MKASDLGIDIKTGYHDRRLTAVESKFLGVLWTDHVGQGKKIPADTIALRCFSGMDPDKIYSNFYTPSKELNQNIEYWKREVRIIHNHLLRDHSNIPVLSKAGSGGGYWIAGSEAEAEEFYATFRKRGLTGLVKATRGKQAAVVEAVQQLVFEFEDLVDQTGFTSYIKPRVAAPMAPEIVDALLEKMTMNPEKFADGLRKIGEKYGSVLLPRATVAAMQAKARELQEMAAGLS